MYAANPKCPKCAGIGAILIRGQLARCSCVVQRKADPVNVKALLVVAVVLFAACAPAVDPPRDVVTPVDVVDVYTPPADTGCASINGAAACQQLVGALCARVIMCCNAAGPSACMPWAYTDAMCRGHIVAAGLDCAAPSRTSATVCQSVVDTCVGDVPLIACSDILGGTVNTPHSCATLP